MNTTVNYFFEANLIIAAFLLIYYVFLKNETDFKVIRFIMLGGLVLAVTIPLVHFNNEVSTTLIPSLRATIPTVTLQEVVIGNIGVEDNSPITTLWPFVGTIYVIGLVVASLIFGYQLLSVGRFFLRSNFQNSGLKVIEVPGAPTTFSFFNHVFVGGSNLSPEEKAQIISHESIHAKQYHSIDILLVRLISVVFWFNPLLKIYHKIFVQIHEFEADARAVEVHNVDRYCNLLARVALQNAGVTLGNHFNNSLTLKRIKMMRTLKAKVKNWKMAVLAVVLPFIVFTVACQDQISAKNEGEIPTEAKEKFTQFKQQHPGNTFIVEYDGNEDQKLEELETQFGAATHIELFTLIDDGRERTFSFIQYATETTDNTIFSVVEEMPEFKGGFDGMVSYLQDNMRYPAEARKNGVEGTTYVSFVVEKDGTLTDYKVERGFNDACDQEALAVVKQMPPWTPAKQGGQIVRTRMVLPLKFKL